MSENKQSPKDALGFSDRSYRILAVGILPFFLIQTLVFALMPFRMSTTTLAIQLLGLGSLWVYAVYHVLGHQDYLQAFVSIVP
jgi:hypothetical protein